MFLVSIKGFIELVRLTPFLTNFSARPVGNKKVAPVAIKPHNILTSCNCYQNFC